MKDKEPRRPAKTVVLKMVRKESEAFAVLFQFLYIGVFILTFCYALIKVVLTHDELVRAISVLTAVLSYGFLLITATIAGYLEEREGEMVPEEA